MGVVYKAHDTKLDRDVALKFLPRNISQSDKERNRFIHEAKAASALEHPNICTIHEVGETPDGQMFIVMGYYDGVPIGRKVERGRLDLSEAVAIAIQIAEGLEAAHDKGIVHRDIKSSNIIVSERGQVRILDFGLARKSGLSKLTKTGTTVGTASYMSPEQARGEVIDKRSDLWSLGVVLYEMVTGKLPFRGEHEAAILYSVVNEEPKPLEVSISGTSPELIHIIGRALEKDVTERYQSASEMLVDLKRLRKETSRTGFQPIGTKTARLTRRGKSITIRLSALILLAAAVVYLMFFYKPSININPEWKQRPLTIPFTEIGIPGISCDGNWIAFSATDTENTSRLYFMNVKGGEPRRVTPVKDIGEVDISPDGSQIFYSQYNPQTRRQDGYIIYSNGGTPRRIIEGGCFIPRFRPDGLRVGYSLGWLAESPSTSGKPEFWSVGIDGRDPRREFIDSTSLGLTTFSYSPDGRKVAFVRFFREGYNEVMIRDLETGQENQVTFDRKQIEELTWIRDDKIVYTTNKSGIMNVWLINVNGGDPVPITKLADPVLAVRSSLDGQSVFYLQNSFLANLWIVDISEKRSHQVTFDKENQYYPAFSPDGKKIAYITGTSSDWPDIYLRKGPSHLSVVDRNGGNWRQLTFGDDVISRPVWSPDGKRISYGSRTIQEPVESLRVYVIELSNPGSPKYIAHGDTRWWLDSTRLQVIKNDEFYVASADGDQLTKVYEDSTHAFFTPGGKYILYHDYHLGKDTTVWWIVDGKKPRDVQKKTARMLPWHSRQIIFSGDGKILYSFRGVGEIWRIILPDGKEERIPVDFSGVTLRFDFSPSWNGKEILIVKRRSESKIVMIENLFK